MRRKCELCGGAARMYCESDQASLCWDCDKKVHGANFLVAKHTRCLLCSVCQSPTPWKAAGPRLGPTISVCSSCVSLRKAGNNLNLSDIQNHGINSHDFYEDRFAADDEDGVGGGAESYDNDEDDDEEDEEYGDDNEDGENQVVPWAAAGPGVSSSSSASGNGGGLAVKRKRENSDLASSDV